LFIATPAFAPEGFSASPAPDRPEYFSKVTEWIPDSIAIASLGSLPG